MSNDPSRSSEDNTTNVDYGLDEFEGEESETAADGEMPAWSGGEPSVGPDTATESGSGEGGPLLDPDSVVDDTLTTVVGAAAGVVIGFVTTVALLVSTTSVWLGLGLGGVAWLGSTAFLVRRRSVVGAVSRGAYGVGIVLLLVPFIAFSPATQAGGIAGRAASFLAFMLFMAVPAGIAGVVGYVASRFDPVNDRRW